MRNVLDISLKNLKWIKIRNKRMANVLLLLSFVVTIGVFWGLRQPGLTLAGDATCGIVEHTHDDECGTKICICDLSEEQHIHDDLCYEVNWIEGEAEFQLICEDTDENHIHTDDCFIVEEAEAYEELILTCDLSEEAHVHEEVCYEWDLTCGLEEHVHSIRCYSDPTADVETVLDWEEMFAEYPYTGDLREDLVGIAMTQVGYSESELNFEVDDDGIRHGYTRYGAWHGTPYRDWSAMFVSFCLNYAGADMDETPGNTGAKSMAKRWNKLGKYAEADEYTPVSGDLVFFDDNTVGIVAEAKSDTVYVIHGDVDDEVCTELFAMTDQAIDGWGSTVGTVPEIEEPSDSVQYEEYMLDISNGPAFYIFEDDEVQLRINRYSFRSFNLIDDLLSYFEEEDDITDLLSYFEEEDDITDLLSYLETNNGSYFFTLLDKNNHELPKDDHGNYIAQADTGYKLTITFNSPEGFLPGTYQYQVPNGMMVNGGEGEFVLKDGTNVGSWKVTDEGLITLVFNDHINSRTDITISATMGIHFPEQEEPIDFDGKITVIVEKPQQEIQSTTVKKWGSQGNPVTEKSDPTKIYWTVQISGNRDSDIPGSVLSDQILHYDWSYEHQYTASDIAGGLSFGASVVDPETGEELYWHRWTVSVDDPDLIWDEDGWTYEMPETITCHVCGNEVELGNEYWTYYVDYTSTPDATDIAGDLAYTNRVEIDDQSTEGWAEFTQTEVHGAVFKNGSFVSDAGGGKFLWELKVTIPGRKAGEKAFYDWFINDTMTVRDQWGTRIAYTANDIHEATVTANYHGKTITVPRIQDATEDDPYAWMVYWSNDQGGNGFYDLRQIYILCRCDCTAESCALGNCWTYGYWADDGRWVDNSGYCPCWTETEDTTFTFTYQTKDVSTIGAYGGLGYKLQNEVLLAYGGGTIVDDDYATILIPSVLKKELIHDFVDGYTANYKVTVNESKLVLTNGSPLVIHDVMTDTLAYISGSLVITSEDGDGDITTLRQGVDYYVTYDGTGDEYDDYGNPVHILDIVILHPQPVMYILDYDATLIMPEQITEGIRYSNSATITLWGQDITDTTAEKVYADINIAAKSYRVEMFKTAAETGEPLGGATFGLYNEKGGLITSAITDGNGQLHFQTNVVQGIILREHILYYMQELKAPDGYRLDDTKYWFCFCDTEADNCDICDEVLAGQKDAVRIPFEQIGNIRITNELMRYQLPVTGGPGIYPLILVSVMLIFTPLVYIYGLKQRRKRERRRARRYSRTSTKRRQR